MSQLRIADCELRIGKSGAKFDFPFPNPEPRVPNPEFRRDGGFTLIEVVVGLFLLTIGLLSLAGAMSTSAKRQSFSQSITTMTVLANATLEQIRRNSYSTVVSSMQNAGTIANFPRYQLQMIVTPNGDNSAAAVEVRVTDQTGVTVSLQTVVTP